MTPAPISSSLFPYTTLFRSHRGDGPDPPALAILLGDRRTRRRIARDRKSTRLNSSHVAISYAVFCLQKKNIVDFASYLTYTKQGLEQTDVHSPALDFSPAKA